MDQSDLEIESADEKLPENMTFTENNSFAYGSTESQCLDFFFEVLQNTPKEHILEILHKAWDENPLLTLKLIFQLRDVRNGKASLLQFHHCLIWLFYNHPLTLNYNLEFVAQHGYWKDLSWFIKFLVEGEVTLSTERQCHQRNTEQVELSSRDYSLEEIIRKRVDGLVSKQAWTQYLKNLPSDEARNETKMKFQEIANMIHIERSKEAKTLKKSAKAEAVIKITNFKSNNPKFSATYDKIVCLFSSALMRDKDALKKDNRLPTTALVGKWAPSIGGSIDLHTSLGKNIARALFLSNQKRNLDEPEADFDKKAFTYYRREFLTPLRTSINVPERLMSKRKWSEVEYERVPSVCMKRNKKIFLKKDPERFGVFLSDVKSGTKKIASGALLPHQIVSEFMRPSGPEELLNVAELQWNDYVQNLKKSGLFESALSVCDVSGSMNGEPMQVAIALSLLTAALSKPPFNSYICSFSATPSFHKVDKPTLKEKVAFTKEMDWGMNTNMQAVFDLILELAISTKLLPEEMVKTLFIFSDMEFDQCGGKEYETDYQFIKRKFEEAGYPLPSIVFWNLCGGKRSKPVTKDEKNVVLVSGFSGQMMKTFLESGDFGSPYKSMLDTLGNKYDHLKVID